MFEIQGRATYFLTGASFLDIYIKLPATIIFSILLIIIAGRMKKYLIEGDFKRFFKNFFILLIYIAIIFLVLFLIYAIWIKRNRLQIESKYIDKHINNTKEAYAIKTEEHVIEEAELLESDSLIESQNILGYIPIVNNKMVENILNQEEKNDSFPMYKYINPYLIKYNGNIAYFAIRELAAKKGNNVFEYTHGNYAKILSANMTDGKEEIYTLQNDYENQIFNGIKITEPRIYYGLETKTNAIVKTMNGLEFDYLLTPTKIKKNTYNGSGGLKLGFIDRMIMLLKTGKAEGMLVGKFKEDTKVLFNREILTRASSIIPELNYETSPYMIVTDEGRLMWVIDGYTYTDRYPYSQKIKIPTRDRSLRDINYVRASAKVFIDAYDGSIKYYISDDKDPIMLGLQKKYKNVFLPMNTLSKNIKDQLRYPKTYYDIQSEMIKKYHTNSNDIFYLGEDIWELSVLDGKSQKIGEKNLEYTIFKNEDQEKADIGFVTLYTPFKRQNINAYLIANMENGVPKLKLYSYSKNENIPGINFIQHQIMQDESIKKELEAINVIGTSIESYSQLIPLNNSMIYIENIYQVHLNKNNKRVLKKVIVANGSKVGIGNTLNSAITNLFSDLAINIDIHDPLNREILIESIIRTNRLLENSIASGDLEASGKYTIRLNDLIRQLEKLDAQTKKKKETDKNKKDKNKPVKIEDKKDDSELKEETYFDSKKDDNKNTSANTSINTNKILIDTIY